MSGRFKGSFQNWESHLLEGAGPRMHNLKGIFFQKNIPVPGEECSGATEQGPSFCVLGSRRRHISWLCLRIWKLLLKGRGPPWHRPTMSQGINLACGKRTWQHLKFGRVMQRAGSPPVKYEGNRAGTGSLKFFKGFSEY